MESIGLSQWIATLALRAKAFTVVSANLRHSSQQHAGGLWAITSYFNPLHYRRRRENYRAFRDNLSVPLVTVELSFDGEFQLKHDDAEVLVQLHGGDVLWQKERLLNIALQSVPADCDSIAWLDCDVIFDSSDWSERTRRALDRYPLVHLFYERIDLRRDETLNHLRCPSAVSCGSNGSEPTESAVSIVHKVGSGEVTLADLAQGESYRKWGATGGLAWASRREVLQEHGLYDAGILGSGDRAIFCAALGEFNAAITYMQMNAPRAEHYLSWARPFFATVCGQIGSIPGRVFHLWHGELKDRRYTVRDQDFAPFDFDPTRDIAVGPNGCWRWNSDKPDMHAFVRHYFASRNEDGDRQEADASSAQISFQLAKNSDGPTVP